MKKKIFTFAMIFIAVFALFGMKAYGENKDWTCYLRPGTGIQSIKATCTRVYTKKTDKLVTNSDTDYKAHCYIKSGTPKLAFIQKDGWLTLTIKKASDKHLDTTAVSWFAHVFTTPTTSLAKALGCHNTKNGKLISNMPKKLYFALQVRLQLVLTNGSIYTYYIVLGPGKNSTRYTPWWLGSKSITKVVPSHGSYGTPGAERGYAILKGDSNQPFIQVETIGSNTFWFGLYNSPTGRANKIPGDI